MEAWQRPLPQPTVQRNRYLSIIPQEPSPFAHTRRPFPRTTAHSLYGPSIPQAHHPFPSASPIPGYAAFVSIALLQGVFARAAVWKRMYGGHTPLCGPVSCGAQSPPANRGVARGLAPWRPRLPNNAMQLTKGGWMRVEASSSAGLIVTVGEVVRPSQLIASVRRTMGMRGGE
jgi:hypothetical protein